MITGLDTMKDYKDFPCRCGSKNCVGYILRSESRWRIKKSKKKLNRMKKILFVSNRNPFSGRYSRDVIRAKKIVNYLSKNNFVKVVSINRSNIKKKYSRLSFQGFRHENLLFKIFYIIITN